MIERQKWVKEIQNPEVGDLVYMKDMDTSPLAWPLGRIAKGYPGLDEKVKVVDVQTADEIYKRPINIFEYKIPPIFKQSVNKLVTLDVK